MASIACIRETIRRIAIRYGKSARLTAGDADVWAADLASIPDDRLTAAVNAWPDDKHAPTLAGLRKQLGLTGAPVAGATSSWPAGCESCDQTGLRVVIRHRHPKPGRPTLEERMAACSCALGQVRHERQGLLHVGDVDRLWRGNSATAEGPTADPSVLDRIEPDRRAGVQRRAELRYDHVRELLGELFDRRPAARGVPARWEPGEVPL